MVEGSISRPLRGETPVPEVPETLRINAATLDAPRHVTLRLSAEVPPDRVTPDRVRVRSDDGADPEVRAVYPFAHTGPVCGLYSVELDRKPDYVGRGYRIEVSGIGRCAVTAGLVLDVLRPPRDVPMGAIYTREATTFRVFAPTARRVEVVVTDTARHDGPVTVHAMKPDDDGVWTVRAGGDLAGRFYAYRLSGAGFDPEREITDIHATCTQARRARSLIVDLRATDPPGFRDRAYAVCGALPDAVIYELHVRDFTISPDSGVVHQGGYLGAAEPGRRLVTDDSVATGLDHLVEMGVTHVQLMPVHDADNDETPEDQYQWGYMPAFFNSPDGWYATDRYGSAKITELKRLIDALHARGIGVVLDMVYNHTSAAATFDALVPRYYYRHRADGLPSNGSGCGNEFYSERWMARRFIIDSLTFWAREYRVDGFRFDLMGLIDGDTLRYARRALDELREGILLYGEPWVAGPTTLEPVTDKRRIAGSGVGAFNDRFRDGVKGDRDDGGGGFVQTGGRRDQVISGLKGGVGDWSSGPADCVNYFEAHDNLTAWDKLLKSAADVGDRDRRRMMRLADLLLLTAQGGVFLHCGQEFCRTKQGHANSYNLPDRINQIVWARKKDFADVAAYNRQLIALRTGHPALRLRTAEDIARRVSTPDPPADGCIVYQVDGTGLQHESASVVLVLANGSADAVTFTLPDGTWSVYADADRAAAEPIGTVSGAVDVAAHSGMLLIRA